MIIKIIFLALTAFHSKAETLIELKVYLKDQLSGSPSMSKESFSLSATQKADLKKLVQEINEETFTFYYGKSKEGKLEKACTVVLQSGKEGPMKVATCFDSTGKVKDVSVLEFQEERGRPVKEQTFLRQFLGKSSDDKFKAGQNIDVISGASMSSVAVIEAVQKASFAYKNFIGSAQAKIGK